MCVCEIWHHFSQPIKSFLRIDRSLGLCNLKHSSNRT
uniref:Uncharacterized protein n=1 Tax=Anguilla anguilla TaxID=7936 RepID=A0A0E9V274_ANGAN